MARNYAPYRARINALEQIDILLNNALENYQSDFDYYEALHNEQPEEDWRYQELENARYKVSIMKEVIDWFEKHY